VILILLLCL